MKMTPLSLITMILERPEFVSESLITRFCDDDDADDDDEDDDDGDDDDGDDDDDSMIR